MYRDRAERAEQRKMDVYAKEVERIDHIKESLIGTEYHAWSTN